MSRAVPLVSIRNLTVTYGSFTAVRNLSCEIYEGCTGLLGPNGAGKTTLIKTILGFIKPTSGEGTICGYKLGLDTHAIRRAVGPMPEQECHIAGLSAVGFVAFGAEMCGVPPSEAIRRAHEVLEYSGLGEARYRSVETYSTGMKQRLKLAQALVHGPKLLLLDEPTNGLDPKGREEMLDLIEDITQNKGVNVLISSHLLPDIERVCQRVVVLQGGQVVQQGLIRELKSIEGEPLDVTLRELSPAFVSAIAEAGGSVLPPTRTTYRVLFGGTKPENVRRVMEAVRRSGAQIRGIKTAERSLEEAFLKAVGR